MNRIGLFFTLLLITICMADDCVIDNRGKEVLYEVQLRKCLNNAYSYKKYPPNTNESFVEVNTKFILKSFSFDSIEELFSVNIWLHLAWKDDRLTWKPEDYGNLKQITMYSHDIWYPSLRFMNGDVEFDYKSVFMVLCEVYYTGEIKCMQRVYDRTVCSTKLWDWPYDSQQCKLEVGVWEYPIKKVKLIFSGNAINMLVAGYGKEWDITDYKQEEDQSSKMQLRMIFTLERHGQILAAILIYPGVVLAVITLTSLFIDVRKNMRIFFTCFALSNLLIYFGVLEEIVPKHSAEHPSLFLFYRGSVIITVVNVLMSIFLKSLCGKETPPSAWIERISEYVINSWFKYLILKWTQENEKYVIWLNFASIVNSFAFYLFTIIYVSMYFSFIPQPIPFN